LPHDDLAGLGGQQLDEGALFPDALGEGTDVDVQRFLLGWNGGRTLGV
jgi:hypothetical protein